MEVREARVEDAEAIERIRIRGWQAAYRDVFPPDVLDALEVDATWWRAHLAEARADAHAFVAEIEGEVVGFATTGPSARPGRFGEVHALYVDPDVWSKGIGRALLGKAEATLAGRWDEAVLWTLEDVPLTRRFYAAAGWREDGERGTFERFDVEARIVRYHKRLRASTP